MGVHTDCGESQAFTRQPTYGPLLHLSPLLLLLPAYLLPTCSPQSGGCQHLGRVTYCLRDRCPSVKGEDLGDLNPPLGPAALQDSSVAYFVVQ